LRRSDLGGARQLPGRSEAGREADDGELQAERGELRDPVGIRPRPERPRHAGRRKRPDTDRGDKDPDGAKNAEREDDEQIRFD
jgi:hypothetical protein